MADTLETPATGSIDSHPDFPEFFRQAQEEMWGTFGPRVEQAMAGGNQAAVERIMAEMERQARQRAVVATRAMVNFGSSPGAMFSRPFVRRDSSTLAGVEDQPEAPPVTAPPIGPTAADFGRLDPSAPMSAPVTPTPGSMHAQGRTIADDVTDPSRPSLGRSLQAFGASLATPFGLGRGGPVEEIGPAQTLSGEQTPVLYQGIDMGAVAAQDPMADLLGQVVGTGPALRGAGAIGRAVASSPPVQAIGRTLARPAVGVPAALGGSLLATTGEAQAPTALDQAASVRASIAELQAQQKTLNAETAALGRVPDGKGGTATFQERFGNVGPNSTREEIRALQEFLASPQGYGLYSVDQQGRPVRPDGIWFGRGGATSGTQAAMQAYLKRLDDERKARSSRLSEIGSELGPLQAQLRRLDANAASATAEANMPWYQRLVRDYGPMAAGTLGAVFAGGFRRAIRSGAETAGRATSAEAEALLARGAASGDVGQQVGAINQFYARGGGRPPFTIASGSPTGFTPSAAQQGATELYPPSSSFMRAPDLYRWLGFGGPLGLGLWREPMQRQQLEAAQKRYDDNPTDENAAALRRAQYLLSAAQASQGFGIGGLASYPVAAGFMRYRPTRPDLARAEGEVMRLNALTRPRPTPIPDAEVLRRRGDSTFSIPPGTPRIPGEVERWVSPEGENIIYRDPNTGHWMRVGPRIRGGRPHRFPNGPPRTYRMISAVDAGDSGTAVG